MDISFIRFVIYSRTMKIYLNFSICIMSFALFFLSEEIKAQEINEADTSVYAQIEIEEADQFSPNCGSIVATKIPEEPFASTWHGGPNPHGEPRVPLKTRINNFRSAK